MIVTVEATPDTVVTLATGAKVVVCETPEQVADEVRGYRTEVLSEALRNAARSGAARQLRRTAAAPPGGRRGPAAPHPS